LLHGSILDQLFNLSTSPAPQTESYPKDKLYTRYLDYRPRIHQQPGDILDFHALVRVYKQRAILQVKPEHTLHKTRERARDIEKKEEGRKKKKKKDKKGKKGKNDEYGVRHE